MRIINAAHLLAVMSLATQASMAQDSLDIKYKGAGWLQVGRIMHSTDSLVNAGAPNNINGNWVQAAGVQLSSVAKFGPNWEGGMGMGALQTHNARGDVSVANNWYPYWVTFVSEARLSYTRPVSETQKLQVNLGYFNYSYNPDTKDLGLYLLRGYAYPAAPISGFEARHTTPAANIFGGMFSYTAGPIKEDLLVISETENRPYFDISVADVVTWQMGTAFQLGAGVNLYRVLPRNKKNNSPGRDCNNTPGTYAQIDPLDQQICFIQDTISWDSTTNTGKIDTLFGTQSGTKLMGRFRFDPKPLFGWDGMGKQDLVLYGELGVFGLKNYRKYYNDIKRRMPVMIGLNLPAMGWLDKCSIELEYYASKNYSDYGKGEVYSSWVPRTAYDENNVSVDNSRDDIKWAFYFSKAVLGHLRLSGQVANDHLRMFGPPEIGYLTYAEALTTPKDWYWMFKSTYFF